MTGHDSETGIGTRERTRGRLLVGLVVLVVWGLITHGTFAGSGDEPHYMMIAHSLAFDADLDLTNDYRDATLIGSGTLKPGAHAIERDGHLRPVHDIGMPLAMAPIVRIAYSAAERLGDIIPTAVLNAARLNNTLLLRHEMSLVMALLTGLLARELLLTVAQAGAVGWSAFAWSFLFAISPPIVSHGFLFFTEIPTALMLLVVFRRIAVHPLRTVGAAVAIGALAGFLWLVHARNVGIVAGLVVLAMSMVIRRKLSGRLFAVFLAAVAIGVIGRTLTTFVLWGSLVTTPHATLGVMGSGREQLREIFVRGTGLLFDREYGLVAYAPIYLLAAPGLALLWKRGQPLYRDLATVIACYLVPVLLPYTNVHGWTGGWTPAARFLVPIAPLLWIPLYHYISHADRRGRVVIGILVVVQLTIDAVVWQFPKMLWNDGDGVSAAPWSQWLPTWTNSAAMLTFALCLVAMFAWTYVSTMFTVRSESPKASSRTAHTAS